MESQTHTLANLFAQLGLPNEPRAMEAFIATHAPLADAIPLAEAGIEQLIARAKALGARKVIIEF